MEPFRPAIVPESEIQLVLSELQKRWEKGEKSLRDNFSTREDLEDFIRGKNVNETWYKNDKYQVVVEPVGTQVVHLSIKRNDRRPVRDWRDLQQIKNELVGAECEGLELYPAESRLVDTANQFHLWVFLDPTYRIPFGYNERAVSNDPIGKAKQRQRKE